MPGRRDPRARQLLAQEAARILLEEGVQDFGLAKRKAAQRLGMARDARDLPTNLEIDAEMRARQRLFQADADHAHLTELRRTALHAMRLFEGFEPRLVGSVLSGTAHAYSNVNLHVFTDVLEEVDLRLHAAGIPFRHIERALREGGKPMRRPGVSFLAGSVEIEALVFPFDALRQAPSSPLDGRPMSRASLNEVERLLEDALDRPASE